MANQNQMMDIQKMKWLSKKSNNLSKKSKYSVQKIKLLSKKSKINSLFKKKLLDTAYLRQK